MCVSAGAVRFTAPPKPVRSKAWALLEGEQREHLQRWNEDRKVCFAECLEVGSVCFCVRLCLAA